MKRTHSHSRNHRIQPGFTLVELLVSITIIAVLALLSMMFMSRMRESAYQVTSTRNLSQLQLANAAYATDHNGMFCPVYTFDEDGSSTSSWWKNPDFVGNLVGGELTLNSGGFVTKVPSSLLDPVAYRSGKKNHDQLLASYGYNDTGFPGAGYGGKNAHHAFRMSQLLSPGRSAAFFTATDWIVHHRAGKNIWNVEDYKQVEGFSGGQKFAVRYDGKVLVSYYDGRVGQVSLADLRKIESQGGSKNIFWDADGQ